MTTTWHYCTLLVRHEHLEKSALPRPLAKADDGKDMSLNRCFQGKPAIFEVPVKVSAVADHELAIDLTAAITRSIEKCCGYLYLKVWVMPDGNRWYKVGITNKPSRREAEQNVLPVAAVTVKLVQPPSMDHARAAEKAIHLVLDDRRIREANNRELFHLADPQLAALCEVLVQLGDEVVG